MKQTLETLKSYFETGDKPTQAEYEDLLDSLVHKDNITDANTVFIDVLHGDDATAGIENRNKPFQTIDAAITAFEAKKPRTTELTSYEHSFLTIALVSTGTYPINGLLPQRNIHFSSNEICTIDLTDNINEVITGVEAGTYYKYLFSLKNGTLLNNSENKISGSYLIFEGEFDVLENYGAAYSLNGLGNFIVYQANVTYKLLKGRGSVFSTRNSNVSNTFKGDIESVGGDLMINNEGTGTNYFDFDNAEGTHKVSLVKSGLSNRSYVNFGKHKPNVSSEIMKIGTLGKIFINFKSNAEVYGSFNAGETHLAGSKVTVNASLARLQGKLFFDNLSVVSTTNLCSVISGGAQFFIKDSHLEVASSLVAIETNTAFNTDSLVFIGHNTVYQTGTPGSNLVTKYATANPTNFSSKVELQNSLITNGVLNTTITGNSDSIATLTIGTTNTY
ncbi:hypothetical protein H2O64_19855 [Kordia sp. YSTF-M3]|uniref:Uncharacterized protein n=1 Tax=Kordia aestuariivivens TaxID=2759037 RepID=A0ABR7QEH6_9FLAO|nr:hypothetical protein [Kordia aestuariivivens]MBC8756937.1 hypothetical protein [Kordia aestuariivivens]